MTIKGAVALALLGGATAALLPLAPAHAADSITANPATASADANTLVALTGRAAGGAATKKVVQQTYEGGRWITRASDTSLPGGAYSVQVRGTRPGAVKYRTVAVNAAGTVLATSAAVSVTWFSWQPLVSARHSFQSVAGNGWVNGITNDGTFSFAGTSYDRSLQYVDYQVSSVASVAAHYYVAKGCTALRYALGMDSQSHANYSAKLTLRTDGAVREEVTVRHGGPAEHRQVSLTGVNEVSFFLDMVSEKFKGDRGKVDVGTPRVRCKTDIRR